MLRANIKNLKLAVSDQNLELIPDYEQRIGVLQELKFIDENSTVLLKGRVACEVDLLLPLLRRFHPDTLFRSTQLTNLYSPSSSSKTLSRTMNQRKL